MTITTEKIYEILFELGRKNTVEFENNDKVLQIIEDTLKKSNIKYNIYNKTKHFVSSNPKNGVKTKEFVEIQLKNELNNVKENDVEKMLAIQDYVLNYNDFRTFISYFNIQDKTIGLRCYYGDVFTFKQKIIDKFDNKVCVSIHDYEDYYYMEITII